MPCDINQILMSNPWWSERPSSNWMEQVRELLGLINRKRLDGVIVVTNFTFRWIQSCKERAHPKFEFRGDTDGTHVVPEEIDRDKVKRRIMMFFNLMGRLSVRDQ